MLLAYKLPQGGATYSGNPHLYVCLLAHCGMAYHHAFSPLTNCSQESAPSCEKRLLYSFDACQRNFLSYEQQMHLCDHQEQLGPRLSFLSGVVGLTVQRPQTLECLHLAKQSSDSQSCTVCIACISRVHQHCVASSFSAALGNLACLMELECNLI